ncbi:hypothetical protein BDZ91DRAFT_743132 [Kalaharituber pfeilii]|nr:hypothetical protein BDZ91DRAFT_743132 [Kalaharituber pfeilii]
MCGAPDPARNNQDNRQYSVMRPVRPTGPSFSSPNAILASPDNPILYIQVQTALAPRAKRNPKFSTYLSPFLFFFFVSPFRFVSVRFVFPCRRTKT